MQAVVDLTRRFLPGMLARGKGGVLNVASVEGFMPVPYQATYAAAKAFVLSFTRALAYETMGTGVRVWRLRRGRPRRRCTRRRVPSTPAMCSSSR